MSLWTSGAGMIIWLAGLQSIPPQLYEAASIDELLVPGAANGVPSPVPGEPPGSILRPDGRWTQRGWSDRLFADD